MVWILIQVRTWRKPWEEEAASVWNVWKVEKVENVVKVEKVEKPERLVDAKGLQEEGNNLLY